MGNTLPESHCALSYLEICMWFQKAVGDLCVCLVCYRMQSKEGFPSSWLAQGKEKAAATKSTLNRVQASDVFCKKTCTNAWGSHCELSIDSTSGLRLIPDCAALTSMWEVMLPESVLICQGTTFLIKIGQKSGAAAVPRVQLQPGPHFPRTKTSQMN